MTYKNKAYGAGVWSYVNSYGSVNLSASMLANDFSPNSEPTGLFQMHVSVEILDYNYTACGYNSDTINVPNRHTCKTEIRIFNQTVL